jgi:type II secretory pathway pseudopilin PulG
MDEYQHSTQHHRAEYPAAAAPAPAKSKRRPNMSMKGVSPTVVIVAVVVALLLAAGGTAAYYMGRYNDSQKKVKQLSNPTEAAKLEQQQLLTKVAALTVLPSGETPTVATVTDVTKLKGQAFFVNAVNGDKVLIYTSAKKAYLYRPSTNKIINIAPVNLGSGTNTKKSSTTNSTTNTSNSTSNGTTTNP